jgi:hypothetical protein
MNLLLLERLRFFAAWYPGDLWCDAELPHLVLMIQNRYSSAISLRLFWLIEMVVPNPCGSGDAIVKRTIELTQSQE